MARKRPANARTGKTAKPEPAPWRLWLIRIAAWALALLVVAGLLWGLRAGLGRLFFTGNPHYELRQLHVAVRTGALTQEQVRAMLAEQSVQEGDCNLYELDLGALRQALEQDVMVRRVELRRELPETLDVQVFGRSPMAQLLAAGGYLIDADGVVMPAVPSAQIRALPVITGVPDADQLKSGDQLDSPALRAALEFLRLRALAERGNWLEPRLLQLNEGNQEFRVYLRRSDEHFLRDNAVVTFPLRGLDERLPQVLEIIAQRSASGQWTGSINATYDRMPVEP